MPDFLSSFFSGPSGQAVSQLLIFAVIIGGMYFMMIRPQQKKKKQEDEMRKSIKIGDEIVTIGGIVGKVVSIKDDSDSLVIESGSEKIRLKKWAIGNLSAAN